MYKVSSIQAFQAYFKKHILLAESFTENKGLADIINMCRLKPYDLIKDKQKKLVLHKWWIDEFGNSLKIIKNKRIQIILNDTKIDKSLISCTDPYYGFSIDNVIKISELMYFCYGKNDEYEPEYAVAFLGIDNYLRCFYLDDEFGWQNISPLQFGMRHLKNIQSNQDVRLFKDFANNEDLPFPCHEGEAWLTSLPVNKMFHLALKEKHEAILALLTKENKDKNVKG